MLRQMLSDPGFIAEHRHGPTCFTRERALSFATMVTWLLLNFQNSMRQSLQRLLDARRGKSVLAATKGALSQARAKLKASALVALNRAVVREAESQLRLARWFGHRVIAVDGSALRLPETPEFIKAFGGARHRSGLRPLARASIAFDVMNRIVVSAALAPWCSGERALMTQHLDALRAGDLILLDRGYPALWMFALLQARGIDFCARLDFGLWGRTLDLVHHDADELWYVAPLGKRAQAVCAAAGVSITALRLRVVRVRLKNGEDEFLVTSLLDDTRYPHYLFRDLYGRRWSVEECFKQIKCRVTAENFSGRTELAVYQDFHARILLVNLTNLFCIESDRRIRRDDVTRQRQHLHQTNRHFGLAQLRQFLPRFLLTPTVAMARTILARFASEAEAIRPDRSYPRIKTLVQNEYPLAYKPVA